jgi:hypothetical protein
MGSQFLVAKLRVVHQWEQNEAILFSSIFFVQIHNFFSKLVENSNPVIDFILKLPKTATFNYYKLRRCVATEIKPAAIFYTALKI